MENYLRRIEADDVIVGEVEGKPVGYLRIEYQGLIAQYLGIIGVDEEYQRKGIGTAMIAFLEEQLISRKERKIFKLEGQAVLYSSAEATATESQTWHRAVGFRECGIIASCNEGGIGEMFFPGRN